MPTELDGPISDDFNSDPEGLGPLLMRCRRPPRQRPTDLEGWIGEIGFKAIIISIAMMVSLGWFLKLLERFGAPKPSPPQTWIAMLVTASFIAVVWKLIDRYDDRYVRLDLHERGFRFCGRPFRLDDIEAIHFGRESTTTESVLISANSFFGRFQKLSRRAAANTIAANAMVEAQIQSLRVELKNGEERTLNGFMLILTGPELARFFSHLDRVMPGLVKRPHL